MTVARNLRNKHNATLTERRYKKKGANETAPSNS